MKKIILIPDSFKGTLSSHTVCGVMAAEIKKQFPNAQIVSIPVADGGEGSVDCFLEAVGGVKKNATVRGVFGEEMQGFYGLLTDGKTAVIEMACCAGLPLAEGRLNPLASTTYGVGQLALAAAAEGVDHIILGLGGSATNDGGCGMAAACGIRFTDSDGMSFVPTGGSLERIAHIDASGLSESLKGIKLTAMCDIDNPMYGENGAAYIFGPQKGADAAMVRRLDAGLRHLNEIIMQDLGKDLSTLPGGGAAGAMGAGVHAFLGAQLLMGIEVVLDTVGFDTHLKGADLVFTGEGKIDGQSLRGKVVIGVARRAAAQGVPVAAVVGSIAEGSEQAYAQGVSAIFSINTTAMDFEKSKAFSERNLAITMENITRFVKAITAR